MRTRRTFLETLTVLCGAAFVDRNVSAADQRSFIDVHHHFYPPALLAALAQANENVAAVKGWTPDKSLADMDQAGVGTAIVSITTPGVTFLDAARARKMARECNEYAARLASDHTGRFGNFAILPWPDADGSLHEIEYSLDTLKADGIGMLTSYGAPVFEELNRRKAVVYTHPTTANCCKNLLPGITDAAIEYGTDTSRAIARTVFSGTSMKYPGIRFVFSHAGGSMPFLIERFVNLAKTPQYAAQFPRGFLAEATKFYYDTAQTSNPEAMSTLRKIVPVSQIVFGTDYPYRTSIDHVNGLKECGVFNAQELQEIERDNPLRLLLRRRT